MGELGSDCPENEIVSREEECNIAAIIFERRYAGKSEYKDRPAGCSYLAQNNDIIFNTAKTAIVQNIYPESGVICKRGI